MAKKTKKLEKKVDKAEAKAKKLEKKVDKAEAKAKKLRKEVKKLRARVADADTDVATLQGDLKAERAKRKKHATRAGKLERKLDEARSGGPDVPASTSMVEEPAAQTVLEMVQPLGDLEPAASAEPAEPAVAAGPDETWTVGALRAEARARGISGYSRMGKGALLVLLQ